MKYLVLSFILLPFLALSQITDEIYNKIYSSRPFERISFSEIKKFKIKCVKYTSNRVNPINKQDSLGNRIRGLNLITEYDYERFDSLGMINSFSKKECSYKKENRYSKKTLDLLTNLKDILKEKSDFVFHDPIAKYIISFDKSLKIISVKNYSNWNGSGIIYTDFLNDKLEFKYPQLDMKPWVFFLNKELELKKDSTFLEGTLGCEDLILVSNYKYDSQGRIIKKIDPINKLEEKRKYNTQGDLSEILINGKLYSQYFYENRKLRKIVFKRKVGLKLIEFEY